MKRTINFVANGTRCQITIQAPREYQTEGAPELSITGMADGSAGQCDAAISEAIGDDAPDVARLIELWNQYHLKALPVAATNELESLADVIDGQRYGDAPDIDAAPDIGGDMIDSRDVIRAVEIYREALMHAGVPAAVLETATNANFDPDEYLGDDVGKMFETFEKLRDFDKAGSDYAPDWQYGETAIADSYFTEHAEQLADDIGAVDSDAKWPRNHIDWDAAAAQLKRDYTSIEFDGETYWVR
jgi:hypothetical protein